MRKPHLVARKISERLPVSVNHFPMRDSPVLTLRHQMLEILTPQGEGIYGGKRTGAIEIRRVPEVHSAVSCVGKSLEGLFVVTFSVVGTHSC